MAKKRHHSKEMMRDVTHEHSSNRISRREYGMDFHEDMSAPANMPRNVMDKYWPETPMSPMGMLGEDLFSGAQKQMHEDNNDMRKIMDPKKY